MSLSVSKLTGSVPPLTVIDDKNGITVILNFGKEGPRPDVMVIVITTISKNSSPISNYLFQAVVPKVWYTAGPCYLCSAETPPKKEPSIVNPL
jgi:hypothetical protein